MSNNLPAGLPFGVPLVQVDESGKASTFVPLSGVEPAAGGGGSFLSTLTQPTFDGGSSFLRPSAVASTTSGFANASSQRNLLMTAAAAYAQDPDTLVSSQKSLQRLTGGKINADIGSTNMAERTALDTRSVQYIYQGTDGTLQRKRAPNIFGRLSLVGIGVSTILTPSVGKKFRLHGYQIEITGNGSQASAGNILCTLRDSSTIIFSHNVFVPAVAGTTMGNGYNTGWVWLGDLGYLSSAANNTLGASISAGLTAGTFNVSVAVSEE